MPGTSSEVLEGEASAVHVTEPDTKKQCLSSDENNTAGSKSPSKPSGAESLIGKDREEEKWVTSSGGKAAALYSAMMRGADPRAFLQGQVPSEYPDHLLWRLLIEVASEPPPRPKLDEVNTIEDVVNLLRNSSRILVLTGAGISVSCGIPDFRSRDGIYATLEREYPELRRPEQMFDIDFFHHNPAPFFKFARDIYPGKFKPSPSHDFIKALETRGKLLRNYTQNIDTLEHVAGVSRLVNCHGSFSRASCLRCKVSVEATHIEVDVMARRVPLCGVCTSEEEVVRLAEVYSRMTAGGLSEPSATDVPETDTGDDINMESTPRHVSSRDNPAPILKPDIVFFGESLPSEFHSQMGEDKDQVDLLIVIGTSLKVRPVSLIPTSVPHTVPQILINREPLRDLNFDVELLGDCDTIISHLCSRLGWAEGTELIEVDTLLHDSKPEAAETNGEASSSQANSEQPRSADSAGEGDGEVTGSEDGAGGRLPAFSESINVADKLPDKSFIRIGCSRYVFAGATVELDVDSNSDTSTSGSDISDDDDTPQERKSPDVAVEISTEVVGKDGEEKTAISEEPECL